MKSTIQNFLATLTLAIIALVNASQCAGQQADRSYDFRQPARRITGSLENAQQPTTSRLGNGLLSDLRPNYSDINEGQLAAEQTQNPPQYQPAMPASDSPASSPQAVSDHSSARRTQSYFEGDQPPPVVVVWLNSDLQTQLLSEGRFKQLMRPIPERDSRTQPVGGNAWQADSRSSVRLASFDEAVSEPEPGVTSPPSQIGTFAKRLASIRKRYDSKSKQITADESADSTIKSEMSNLLGLANEWIERAASDLQEFTDETAGEISFAKDLATQEQALADEKERPVPVLFPKTDSFLSISNDEIDKLQKDLKKREAKLRDSMTNQKEVRKQISAREQRVNELPSLKRKNAKDEDETRQLMAELNGQPDDLNRSLQKLRSDAKILSLEITEKSLELESRRQEQIGRILPLKLEELTLQIRRVKDEVVELRKRSDEMRDQQLNERRLAADIALNKVLTKSTPQLKELAEFNIDLVKQKETMAKKGDQLEEEFINVKQLEKKLDESQEQIENQILKLGSTASGIRLVEHRRSLISTGKSQNRLLELAERLQHKQARKLLVKERLDALVLRDDFRLDVMANVEEQTDPEQRLSALNVANELLETEKVYATDLLAMFEDNIFKLSQLEAAHETLIDKVQIAKAFSDKNALWVRSAKPLEFNDFQLCNKGVQSIVTSDQWKGIGDHTYQTFQKRPYDVGLLAMVVGSLLVVRRRLRWSHE